MLREPVANELREERLAVVDHNDRVIGDATRSEVHRGGLRHRAVHILVLNPAGQLYLQRRADHKDCAPGLWDSSAAGHVEAGEDYHLAAPRELAEELGLSGLALQLRWRLPASRATGNEFINAYSCVSSTEPLPDPDEIAASAWYRLADVDAWLARRPQDFTAVFRTLYRRLRDHSLAVQ